MYRNRNLLIGGVSEIRVKRIRVNQGVGYLLRRVWSTFCPKKGKLLVVLTCLFACTRVRGYQSRRPSNPGEVPDQPWFLKDYGSSLDPCTYAIQVKIAQWWSSHFIHSEKNLCNSNMVSRIQNTIFRIQNISSNQIQLKNVFRTNFLRSSQLNL